MNLLTRVSLPQKDGGGGEFLFTVEVTDVTDGAEVSISPRSIVS